MSAEVAVRLRHLMSRRGGVILFGAGHVEAALALADGRSEKAVFSGARIDDSPIPDALMIDCSLIFCHSLPWCRGRGVTKAELEKWSAALLDGIVFRPSEVPGLSPDEIEEPSKNFTADQKTNDLLFLVQWGPVPSSHVVGVARALERAYARLAAP